MIAAMSRNRLIDRGHPHLDAIEMDVSRLGLQRVRRQMSEKNPQPAEQEKLLLLSRSGIRATKQYAVESRACLGRIAKALDAVMWDYLLASFSTDPWSP